MNDQYTDEKTGRIYKFRFSSTKGVYIQVFLSKENFSSFANADLEINNNAILKPQRYPIYERWRQLYLPKPVEKYINKIIRLRSFI